LKNSAVKNLSVFTCKTKENLTILTLLKENHRAHWNSPDNLSKVAHCTNTGNIELIPFKPLVKIV
jgi:hypothetical protein